MKVKSCINPQRWGTRIDLDFPRIYVLDCNDIKGLNVTVALYHVSCLIHNGTLKNFFFSSMNETSILFFEKWKNFQLWFLYKITDFYIRNNKEKTFQTHYWLDKDLKGNAVNLIYVPLSKSLWQYVKSFLKFRIRGIHFIPPNIISVWNQAP